MRSKIDDKDVLQIFTSLKHAENKYPQEMIDSRRDTFAKQAAAMAILAKAGGSGATSAGTGQAATTASSSTTGMGSLSMGKLLETALVIAIVAEAGVAAYVYREKIAEFISSTFGPKVEQAANPPDNSSSDIIAIDENTAESPVGTSTVTATLTPTPPGYINSESEDNNGDEQVASTPAPTDDKNGLHLGQTKQPSKEPKKNDNKK